MATLLKQDGIKITVIMQHAVDDTFVKELSSTVVEFAMFSDYILRQVDYYESAVIQWANRGFPINLVVSCQ